MFFFGPAEAGPASRAHDSAVSDHTVTCLKMLRFMDSSPRFSKVVSLRRRVLRPASFFGNPAIRRCRLIRGFASQPHGWFAFVGKSLVAAGVRAEQREYQALLYRPYPCFRYDIFYVSTR